jgi:hypothetical protein
MRTEIRMITTHVDKHNESITPDALQDLVRLINQQYTPMGVEHDPRIPPVGRVLSAHIKEIEEGEFAVDGIAEIFEQGQEIEFKDDGREIPITEFGGRLSISPDRSYRKPEDQQLLEELRILVDGEITPQLKKSVEPISLLVIAASFIAGGIANGFLSKIGEDVWELFKAQLAKLIEPKRQASENCLLAFEFTVRDGDQLLCLKTILANPSESDINRFLQYGLKELDERTPRFFKNRYHVRKIVFEYKAGKLHVIFGLRKDAVPVSVET